MPSDRIQLLRIPSNLDQSLAKIDSIIEREQTYDGWQAANMFALDLKWLTYARWMH